MKISLSAESDIEVSDELYEMLFYAFQAKAKELGMQCPTFDNFVIECTAEEN